MSDIKVYQGGKDKTGARQIEFGMGEAETFKTKYQNNVDGSVTRVQKKGSMPTQVSVDRTDQWRTYRLNVPKCLWTFEFNAVKRVENIPPKMVDGVLKKWDYLPDRMDSGETKWSGTSGMKTRRKQLQKNKDNTYSIMLNASAYSANDNVTSVARGPKYWYTDMDVVTWALDEYVQAPGGGWDRMASGYVQEGRPWHYVTPFDAVYGLSTWGLSAEIILAACVVYDPRGTKFTRVASAFVGGFGNITVCDFRNGARVSSVVYPIAQTTDGMPVVGIDPYRAKWSPDGSKLIVRAKADYVTGQNHDVVDLVLILKMTRPVSGTPSLTVNAFTPPLPPVNDIATVQTIEPTITTVRTPSDGSSGCGVSNGVVYPEVMWVYYQQLALDSGFGDLPGGPQTTTQADTLVTSRYTTTGTHYPADVITEVGFDAANNPALCVARTEIVTKGFSQEVTDTLSTVHYTDNVGVYKDPANYPGPSKPGWVGDTHYSYQTVNADKQVTVTKTSGSEKTTTRTIYAFVGSEQVDSDTTVTVQTTSREEVDKFHMTESGGVIIRPDTSFDFDIRYDGWTIDESCGVFETDSGLDIEASEYSFADFYAGVTVMFSVPSVPYAATTESSGWDSHVSLPAESSYRKVPVDRESRTTGPTELPDYVSATLKLGIVGEYGPKQTISIKTDPPIDGFPGDMDWCSAGEVLVAVCYEPQDGSLGYVYDYNALSWYDLTPNPKEPVGAAHAYPYALSKVSHY